MSRNPPQVSTTGTRALAVVRRNPTVLGYAITGSHWQEAGPPTPPLPAVALLYPAREKRSR